ncbi:MAG: DUF4349 domain-containing protein [Cyanobacteria bacterium P01_C01_bin.73]
MKRMQRRSRASVWAMPLMGLMLLASCGASLQTEGGDAMAPAAESEVMADSTEADAAVPSSGDGSATLLADTAAVPAARPALIKQAALGLTVESVDDALTEISNILVIQQGDLLELQDEQRFDDNGFAYVTLRLRIPKDNLDATLKDLKALGTVEQQSISAEDVSNQLVDLDARLRNLRQSEESLLKIMDRSGSIEEVLQVSRELSTVRASVEQIDAQLKALQNRVAYSTINLQLIPAGGPQTPTIPIAETLGDTWQSAADSVGSLTVGLLRLGLWLLAYSPYWGAIAIASGLIYCFQRRRPQPAPETTQSSL